MKSSTQRCLLAIETELDAQRSDFSRLVLAASLANPKSRLSPAFVAPAVCATEDLRSASGEFHLRIFRGWLTKTLPEQREDLARFWNEQYAGKALGWLVSLARTQLVPPEATPEEAALFQSDLDVALDLVAAKGDGQAYRA